MYTANVGRHRLLHDIPRFLILVLKELILIFDQMLSIVSFGRREIANFMLLTAYLEMIHYAHEMLTGYMYS